MESMMALDDENINGGYARVRALSKLPCARDNCIGVGALSRHRRRRSLGAIVCDGIARETVEGRGAVSGAVYRRPNSWQKLALFLGGMRYARGTFLGGCHRRRRGLGAIVWNGIARDPYCNGS